MIPALTLLALAGPARAAEYRQLELADGRSIRGEVVNTSDGLDVALLQGRMHLSYEDVLAIAPLDATVYAQQAPWRILVLPTVPDGDASLAVDAQILAELGAMRGVLTLTTPSHEVAMCAGDVACVRAKLLPTEADLALLPSIKEGNTLVVTSAWTGAVDAAPRGQVVYPTDPAALRMAVSMAVHQGLGLIAPPSPLAPAAEPAAVAWGTVPAPPAAAPPAAAPPAAAPPAAAPPAATGPLPTAAEPSSPSTRGREGAVSPALAWVPLPGFPEWVAGDEGSAMAATAVVVPATAAIVYVTGGVSTRPAEHWLLSGLGYYASCVMANRAFLPVVAPVEGGARVGIVGSF